ncbi:MAG: proline--tRNA ligase [Candidatus Diapherotrites archaeon]
MAKEKETGKAKPDAGKAKTEQGKGTEQTLALTVTKAGDFTEWYQQLIQKAELADYTSVSGCMVLRPNAYSIWEGIQAEFNKKIKKTGHRNVYFPLFIPEHLFEKEKEHVEGFEPEVAWVESAGNTKLEERLAIRPTSETIFYESYAKWIRSHRDLPLLLNQWVNIVRWEFKHPRPFIRTREFLWQEGHTAHATKEEAEKEALMILKDYTDLIENFLAIPVLSGQKSESEKFPGADYTLTMEALMPNGKALQMGTSHMLGQNFSKPFDIKFLDEKSAEQFAWQTSWGISTRLIGAMAMVHGDDKGLVVPPKIAERKVVIVPIFFEKSKTQVLEKCAELEKRLERFGAFVDSDENHSPGFKFHQWEMQGIPVRIEVGPRDIEKKQFIAVRRDSGEKAAVNEGDAEKEIEGMLEKMQEALFKKAKEFLDKNTVEVKDKASFVKAIEDGKMAFGFFCESAECEANIKAETQATSRLIPLEQKETGGKCFFCGAAAKRKSYFARNY